MDSKADVLASESFPVVSLHRRRPRAHGTPAPSIISSGFRCFFFSAAVAAIFLIPAWMMILGSGGGPTYFAFQLWHAHEMLFGFTAAVIAGFLLTAASNWTGKSVASPTVLLLLNLLWLAGRLLLLWEGASSLLVLCVDLSFLPLLAAVLGRALFKKKARRNYLFLVLLALLTLANGVFHARHFGVGIPSFLFPVLGRDLALRVIAIMIVVIGGRVFPMFTRNATGASGVRNIPWLDRISLWSVVMATLVEMFSDNAGILAAFWVFAGFSNVVRMSTWGMLHAKQPLLWVLHAGYFATALSFVFVGLGRLGLVPATAALHCFTVGGLGLLTLGMMARVSLGHSGRMLVAPKKIVWAFSLLVGAALVRVLVPWFLADYALEGIYLSGALWTIAFGLFLLFGVSIWFYPRVDSK